MQKIIDRPFSIFFGLMLGLCLVAAAAVYASDNDNFQSEVAAFYAVEDSSEMALEKRQNHFTRSARFLVSHMNEQKALFMKKKRKGANPIVGEVENLLNNANLSAAMGEYATGIETLKKAHKLLTNSIEQLH